MTKKPRQKLKYLENEKSFQVEIIAFFIIFKGPSVTKNCLRPEGLFKGCDGSIYLTLIPSDKNEDTKINGIKSNILQGKVQDIMSNFFFSGTWNFGME